MNFTKKKIRTCIKEIRWEASISNHACKKFTSTLFRQRYFTRYPQNLKQQFRGSPKNSKKLKELNVDIRERKHTFSDLLNFEFILPHHQAIKIQNPNISLESFNGTTSGTGHERLVHRTSLAHIVLGLPQEVNDRTAPEDLLSLSLRLHRRTSGSKQRLLSRWLVESRKSEWNCMFMNGWHFRWLCIR